MSVPPLTAPASDMFRQKVTNWTQRVSWSLPEPGGLPVAPSLRATSADRRTGGLRRASAAIAQAPPMTASTFIPAMMTGMKYPSNAKKLPFRDLVLSHFSAVGEDSTGRRGGLPSRSAISVHSRPLPARRWSGGCQQSMMLRRPVR